MWFNGLEGGYQADKTKVLLEGLDSVLEDRISHLLEAQVGRLVMLLDPML